MNIRKPIDYSVMFKALDGLMAASLPQMKLYCEIGRLVSARIEKGAAVAAAEYLGKTYPAAAGFSPRNLRRMREFFRTYELAPEVMTKAMSIGWTQNVIILEAELTLQERAWYIQAAQQYSWSKLELQRKIESKAHLENTLDVVEDLCYTEENSTIKERPDHDENPVRVLREYMPQPNGRVYYERPGQENWPGNTIPNRVRRHQRCADGESCLSAGPPQAGRAWDQLHWENGPAACSVGLRAIRFPNWDGPGQSAGYARICGGEPGGKIHLLMEYTGRSAGGFHPDDVADPWYTGDFEATWREVLEGCQGLLREVCR